VAGVFQLHNRLTDEFRKILCLFAFKLPRSGLIQRKADRAVLGPVSLALENL